jgi:lysyl-tRNA synthetase class 2
MNKNAILAQAKLIKTIRHFFESENFIDVLTPPMVRNPGMETHIHPFRVAHAKSNSMSEWYLQTSPEFHMKELLSLDFDKIFTISYAFRDEPLAPNHRPQFLMLEWYRKNAHYTQIMKDCENLFSSCSGKNIKIERATIQEIFEDVLQIDILNFLDKKDLKELIENNYKDIPLPIRGEQLSWDDYYFLLFLNKIEPHLANYPFLLLYEFPYHLSALSTLKPKDQRVCERFEIYANGIELCNCFNELTDLEVLKKRFQEQAEDKKALYGYELSEPTVLYNAMTRGLPQSAGIALGIERLLKVITGMENPFWK